MASANSKHRNRIFSPIMRDDLLDAQACVDWAVSQIPIFQNRLLAWGGKRPYEVVKEPDPQTGDYLLVAYLMGPLDPIVNAEVGVVINGIRTTLDLLAASLARRNGKNPSADTHFPIFPSEQCMIDPLTGIEGKKWLSKAERAAIKALKPYEGGDHTIWPLHQLDIRRKHYRLVEARPDVYSAYLTYAGGRRSLFAARGIKRVENKAILHRSTEPLIVAETDIQIAAYVVFNEPEIGLVDQEVTETLMRFANRVTEIIKLFDS